MTPGTPSDHSPTPALPVHTPWVGGHHPLAHSPVRCPVATTPAQASAPCPACRAPLSVDVLPGQVQLAPELTDEARQHLADRRG